MAKAVKTIKNMDKKTWNMIKSESAKHDTTIAEFLKKVTEEHRKNEAKKQWDGIMEYLETHEPIFTEKEADELIEQIYRDRHKAVMGH